MEDVRKADDVTGRAGAGEERVEEDVMVALAHIRESPYPKIQ